MEKPRIGAGALVGAAVLAAALLACKKKVPEEWEALAPTEGLTKAIPMKGDPALGTVPGIMLWYDQSEVSVQDVRSAFLANAKQQGYEQISACPDMPDKPGDGFVKAPKTYLGFSIVPLAKSWDARVRRSDKLVSVSLPANRKCGWLPAAAKFCGGSVPTGETCMFQR